MHLPTILLVFGIAFQLCACETPDQTAIRTQCGPFATTGASRTIISRKFDFSGECSGCCPESDVCCLFSSNDAVLPLINKCNAAGGFGDLQSNTGPVPVNPPNDQFRCKPEFSCTVPCKFNQYSISGSPTCHDCPKPCRGLTTIRNKTLKDNQVVISDDFAKDIMHLVSCAETFNMRLSVQSTSRCGVPSDSLAVQNSDHQLGKAIDASLYLPNNKYCNRDKCMAAGYCAFNMGETYCKSKFSKSPPSQFNATNRRVNGFLKCAGEKGLSVGATFAKKDFNHFERGSFSASRKEKYQSLLKRYCNNECSNVPLGKSGNGACTYCSSYTGKDKERKCAKVSTCFK